MTDSTLLALCQRMSERLADIKRFQENLLKLDEEGIEKSYTNGFYTGVIFGLESSLDYASTLERKKDENSSN